MLEERDYLIEMYANSAELLKQLGYKPSPLGEKVAFVLGITSGGVHNYHPKAKVNWADPYCIEAPIAQLSTSDPDRLIMLIAACTAFSLRLTIGVRGRTLIAQFHDINKTGVPGPVYSEIEARLMYWYSQACDVFWKAKPMEEKE